MVVKKSAGPLTCSAAVVAEAASLLCLQQCLCFAAEKLYKAAQKKLAGDEGESDEEEDDEPSKSAANNPFAALSGLGNAVNAPEFIPHR